LGVPRLKLIAGRQRSSEAPAVPFVDESNILRRDSQPFGGIVSGIINRLSHSPNRQLVAVPLGYATVGLHGNGDRPGKGIAKFPNDIRFCKCFIDVAPFVQRLHDAGPFPATSPNRYVWRLRPRGLSELGSERKNL